jgi:hypothetical protein
VRLEGLGQLIPKPSGLKHSASTNYATARPFLIDDGDDLSLMEVLNFETPRSTE